MNATHATSIGSIAKQEVQWSIFFSILMIVAGFLAMVVPSAAGVAVTVIVGWLLIFSGAAHLVFGWCTRTTGGLVWEGLLGVLYILVGGYVLSHLAAGLASLTIALATYLFLGAALEFALSFKLRLLPGSGWLLTNGIISLILAILIWRSWPSNTPWVIGTLVGVSMLFRGVTRLMLSLQARTVVAKLA